MATKPNIPVIREEMYLDVMTGGSSSLPEPITLEEMYLAKIAGMAVDLPTPRYIKHKYLAKIAGMTVNVPTYTTNLPRIYAYLAKATGQDIEVPQPITREEMYWFDYVNGQPTPSEQEYTGAVPVTFTANGQPLLDYLISGNTVQNGTPSPTNPIQPQSTGVRTGNLFDYSSVATGYRIVWTTGADYADSSAIMSDFIGVSEGDTFFVSPVGANFLAYGLNKNYLGAFTAIGISKTAANLTNKVTIPENSGCKFIRLLTFGGGQSPKLTANTMLNTGSTPLPYEPYGYFIEIEVS